MKIKITKISKNPWREICVYDAYVENRSYSDIIFRKNDWDVHLGMKRGYYCGNVLISYKALTKTKSF